MNISLITHNPNKVKEFKLVLEPEIHVDHVDLEYPELRSDDPKEIVELAAMQLAEKLERAVVVEDSGLFFDALGGFPGTCTAYVFKRIGNKGLLQTMKGQKNRKIAYISAIGFCKPGEKPVSFLGKEDGKLALRESGKFGWGQDPIFIPKGKTKTYGQLRNRPSVNKFRESALTELKKFLIQE